MTSPPGELINGMVTDRGSAIELITVDHKHFAQLADALAISLALSLPWSTSAASIIAALWLIAFIPTLDLQSVRRVFTIPAGGLPALLVVLGGLGMLWADVAWAERLGGMSSFIKLLFIPYFCNGFVDPMLDTRSEIEVDISIRFSYRKALRKS